METRPSYHMGLLHQTGWGLVGTSYRGDPLNVGGSNTVNTSLPDQMNCAMICLILLMIDTGSMYRCAHYTTICCNTSWIITNLPTKDKLLCDQPLIFLLYLSNIHYQSVALYLLGLIWKPKEVRPSHKDTVHKLNMSLISLITPQSLS